MIRPLHPFEIFLQPGDYFFADRDTRISTVLGSCVSMTFWHPRLLVGGMCHYLLPKRGIKHKTSHDPALDGRYADEAIALLLKHIDAVGASHKEYQVKLFGGGDMFPEADKNSVSKIGIQNVEAARQLSKQYGFTCVSEHLGDIGHRNVICEVWIGDVWVRHNRIITSQAPTNKQGV